MKYFCYAIMIISTLIGSRIQAQAASYTPPSASASVTAKIDFSRAQPLDEDYRQQFVNCDGNGRPDLRNTFRGHSLVRPNKPDSQQYYLCTRDPSNLKALLKLADGGVFWESKMALDVDGSWVAWEGVGGATDQRETSFKWPTVQDKQSRQAQIDPDRFPFIVIPTDGLKALTGATSGSLSSEFAKLTGLKMGDVGVVIYKNQWTPVFIADGGPFMRIGEGSARVFEGIGETRCRKWNADKTRCVGPGNGHYPYRDFGISNQVLFIAWPGSANPGMGPDAAITTICNFAQQKLGLEGSPNCRR